MTDARSSLPGTPQRIQRKRTRGWKMPANTIYVGRPTKFGNPFTLKDAIDIGYASAGRETEGREFVTRCFKDWLEPSARREKWWQGPESDERRKHIQGNLGLLRGKNLACFCSLDQPCHADVLIELANAPPKLEQDIGEAVREIKP